jgi:uncharacterized RDD family membrane protein YckC
MADNRFGGFWRRFIAYIVDKLILYLMSLILFFIGLFAMGFGGASPWSIVTTGNLPRETGFFMALYCATAFFMDMFYFIWFHGTIGQTLGKRLLGLRLIRTSGEKMTLGIAFLRWVGSLISGLFVFLGFIWIAIDHRKQGWHDKIAATLVIRTQNGPGAVVKPKAYSPLPSPLEAHSLGDAVKAPASASSSTSIPPATPEDRAEPSKSA